KVAGLSSVAADGTTHTTGAAYIVAVPDDYATFAPGEMRTLVGQTAGAVLQQQTAANLSATVGSTITVHGGPSVPVTGVVDLPYADSFFQVVGAPAGSGASAPPDNVLLVTPAQFGSLVAGATVVHQYHVRLDHASLPADPAKAADEVTGRVNHYTASVAGGALVADDLGASLSAAREDALYARLLVLLLGVPGLLLSTVVTALVIALRNDRQRRDLALLRLRGATPRRAAALLGLIALADGLLGAVLGGAGALLATRLALGSSAHVAGTWLIVGMLAGIVLAIVIELAPVARLLRGDVPTVQDTATQLPPNRSPLALRLGLDVLLLAGSAVVF